MSDHFLRIGLLVVFLPVLVFAVRSLVARSAGGAYYRGPAVAPSEKRQTQREKTDLIMDLADGKGGYTEGNARVMDISVWGARISSAVVLEQGQQIHGRVRAPGHNPIQINGRVVWRKYKFGFILYGIAFDQTASA
jgi:hypothetical protein